MSGITIIVPIYSVEQYIRRCINSILSQTFTDFDVVLVDDGSPDRCGVICDEYAERDPRVHVIHRANGGLSAARNTGIDWAFEHSDSTWISFIDGDDWVHPRYLEILYAAVLRDKTDIAIADALWTGGEELPREADESSKIWETEAYYESNPVNATVAWGKIYRKSCFRNIRYPIGKLHEDEYVTYRILFENKYVSVADSLLYAYFQNSSGITRGVWNPKRLDVLEAVEEQAHFFVSGNMPVIADKRFQILLRLVEQSKEALAQNENLSKEERRMYLRRVNRVLKRALLFQRTYGWFPPDKHMVTNHLLIEVFIVLRVIRKVWRESREQRK